LVELQKDLHLPTDSIGCHCHQLELAVGDALQVAKVVTLIKQLMEFVAAYRTSSRTKAVVKSVLSLEHNEKMPFLPQDVATRWTSTFRMIDAFLNNVDIFSRANQQILQDSKLSRIPGSDQLHFLMNPIKQRLLSKLKELLDPLARAVDDLQGDSYPTLCWVQILAARLLRAVQVKIEEENRAAKRSDTFLEVLKRLEKSIRKRLLWEKLPDNYMPIDYIAPALDPRTKSLYFLQNQAERDAVWKHIEELVTKTKLPDETESNEPDSAVTHEMGAIEQLLYGFGIEGTKTKHADAHNEIQAFQQEPGYTKDPLSWWLQNEVKYPRLAYLARNYLAIPASSATVERIFSRLAMCCL
jgi:hypothetical protein